MDMGKRRQCSDGIAVYNGTVTLAQNLDTYRAADIVNLYLPLTLVLLGCSFNLLTILVMRSPYFRRVSTSVFLIASAINDVTSLLLSLFPHWLYLNYPEVYRCGDRDTVDRLCMFFNFYGYSNNDVTLILTALMTMDRAYAIMYPLRVAAVNNVRRARYAIVSGVGIVSVKNFHLWFCSSMSAIDSQERLCGLRPSGSRFIFFVKEVWPWIQMGFMVVCLLLIVISNIVIIINVKHSTMLSDYRPWRIWRQGGDTRGDTLRRESGAGHFASSSGRLRQTTAMMLVASFTTVILTCPYPLYEILFYSDPSVHSDPAKNATNQLVYSMVFYMLYSNKCFNFFLYVASGRKFRQALKQLLSCGRHSRRHGNQMSRDMTRRAENHSENVTAIS